jgi:hypothetical protein
MTVKNPVKTAKRQIDDLPRETGGIMLNKKLIQRETERILKSLENAEKLKLETCKSLIDALAYETVYLKYLKDEVLKTKKEQFKRIKILNDEIVKHHASLCNITDKLIKNVYVEIEEDEIDELEERFGK